MLPKENYQAETEIHNEPILNYRKKFKNQLSINLIKSKNKEEQSFSFKLSLL